MNILQGAILGLVQGIGEFLPISSSAHLMLARWLLGIDGADPANRIFDILLHVGTLVPILLVFWREWIDMIAHPVRNKTLLKLFVASLPTLAFYVLFDMDMFESGWFMGAAFLCTSLLMLIAEAVSARWSERTATPSFPQAILMGVLQGFALMPGISRSGSTISGGLFGGVKRGGAARFSFMMSAPAVAASLLVEGKHAMDEHLLEHVALVPTLVGLAVACVAGFCALRLMLKVFEKHSLHGFCVYLALLGLCYLCLQLAGVQGIPPFAAPEGMSFIRFLN